MAELVGAVLGAAVGELLKVVTEQSSKTASFKTFLKRLQQTLERIESMLNQTKNLSERLGHRQEEIERFISYIENAKELVNHQISIDALDELDNNAKERFLDLGSFPGAALMDMSVVLYSEELAPSIGCMARDKHNSQTSGSDFSYNSPPSCCDVALRCGSLASEDNGAKKMFWNVKELVNHQMSIDALDELDNNAKECFLDLGSFPEDDRIAGAAFMDMSVVLYSEEAPSIGCVVYDRHNSQTSGSDFSYDSPPSYCDVAPRCGSPASENNGAQNGSNLRDVILWNSNECLGRTKEEIEMFVSYLEKAKELVLKCPRVQDWNVYKKFVYEKKLIRLEDELLRLFQIVVPLNMLNTSMRMIRPTSQVIQTQLLS